MPKTQHLEELAYARLRCAQIDAIIGNKSYLVIFTDQVEPGLLKAIKEVAKKQFSEYNLVLTSGEPQNGKVRH